MKTLINNYTFNALTKQVTLTDYASIKLDQFLLITNVTTNTVIYNFANPALGGSVVTNVLTLDYNTAAMNNADSLQIFVDIPTDFGTGNATATGTQRVVLATNQPVLAISDNGTTISIDDNGSSITVDGAVSAVQSGTWNVTNISGTVSLPTGAATAARQDTLIGHVDGIEASVDGIEALLTSIEADTTAIQAAVQLLDDAVATDGAASVAKLIQVGGTDGSNAQILSTTSAGHLNISDGGNSVTVDGTVAISGTVPISVSTIPTHAVTQSGTWTVQPGNTPNTTPWLTRIGDGANSAAIKAASTSASATDPALVVTISPNNTIELGPTSLAALENINITVPGTIDLGAISLSALETISTAQSGTWTVGLSAGINNIGDVDVASLPGTVATDITAIKTATELIDNAVGTDGSAVGTGMLRVGGTDGTNNQTISVTTTGAVNIADNGGSITVDSNGTFATQVTSIAAGDNNIGNVDIVTMPAVTINGTVPVSGTFYQATQPVSIATMPSTPVTGTFWQATQPVSISSMPSTPVTGPLTDTQLRATPVPISMSSVPSHAVTNVGTFATQVTSISAGDNNIGNVDIITMPAVTGTVELGATTLAALETTNVVQSGTWNINNVAGTVSLPTGASTSAKQDTIITHVDSIETLLTSIESDTTAIQNAVELIDNTILAASTKPVVATPSIASSIGPNSVGYDSTDDMFKVKSVQKKFRDSFVNGALDAAKWDSVFGTGGTITVGSGVLTMGSGTTANADTYILSKETFTVPFRLSFQLTLSQRIANQTFYVEAVSVNPTTLVPDGLNSINYAFDGTTATNAKYSVQNGGAAALISSASTVTTTAGTGIYEIEPFADEAWFHSGILDSTAGRAVSYRRHQQIPDPNAVYKIKLRWLNGSSVPASNTNAVLQFVACQDYAELTAEITAGRGNGAAGQSLGVQVTNTMSVNTHAVYAQPIYSSTTYQPVPVSTTVYAASLVVKTSGGALYSLSGYNSSVSDQFIQIHNATALPANGAVPAVIFRVPGESNFSFDFALPFGRNFTTGIIICNSSTGPTKTLGAADCWFDVQYR